MPGVVCLTSAVYNGVVRRFLAIWGSVILLLSGPACTSVGPYRAAISSDDVNERILGIVAAGEARDRGAVPLLVDRLEDEDDAVRFYAILALERITGKRFGYDYAKQSGERAASVVEWRSYVRRGEHLTSARTETTEVADKPGGEHPGMEM